MFTNSDVFTSDKITELKSRLQSRDPHLMMIAEVKPKNSKRTLSETEYEIDGYQLECVNLDKNIGRGLCTYFKEGVEYKEVKLDSNFSEYYAAEIDINKGQKLLAINIYRSGSSTRENSLALNDLIRKASRMAKYDYIIIAGDVNYKLIDWGRCYCRSNEDSNDFLFLEAVKDAFLTQHIQDVTRARGNDTPSTLDVLLTNSTGAIEDLDIDAPLGKSDHTIIWATLECEYEGKTVTKTRYLYDKANYARMKEELKIDWVKFFNEPQNSGSINNMWNGFKNKIASAMDSCIPKATIKVNFSSKKRKTNRFDRRCLSLIKRKKRLWEKFIETKDGYAYLEYCRVRNQVRTATRKARKVIEKEIAKLAKKNPKKFWQYVNRKTKKRSTIPDLLIEDEDDHTEPKFTQNDQEKADNFNRFFASVFNTDQGPYDKEIPSRTDHELPDFQVNADLVREKLEALKTSKSQGPDGLHPRVLKEVAKQIAWPLTAIFNTSLVTGELPDEWKTANVTAIYKNKGKKVVSGNYRPVSLTCILCKVLESLVREHIMKFMHTHKLFSNKQFGFLNGRSTTLQLLRALDNWLRILDEGGAIDIIYFDFMKAFDKVHHGRLLAKLKSYGIVGSTLAWIKSFLTDRKQRVCINNTYSDWAGVTSGVPQGSVLGPLLFVVFINDLPEVIDDGSVMYLFADDTKLFRHIRRLHDTEVLQNDVDGMNEWGVEWGMFYHPSKCHALKLGHRISELNDTFSPYTLGGTHLETVPTEKDLGVTIDCDLNFEQHMIEKVNKANKMVGIIRRSFVCLDASTFLQLYKAMVRPHLEYANMVWSPQTKKYIELIENVQRRATKMIPGFSDLSYPDRLKKLKLPTLSYRRLRGDLIEIYKILSGKYDPAVCEDFIVLRDKFLGPDAPETRGNSKKIYVEKFRLDVGKYSFPHRAVNIWNDIPDVTVNATTTIAFEQGLDEFMSPQDIIYDYEAKYSRQKND